MKFITIDKLNFTRQWDDKSYGLLIGSIQKEDSYLFLPLECPRENADSQAINHKWVAQHATNVFRMLPGGTTVIGFYVVGDIPEIADIKFCRQILNHIFTKEKLFNYGLFPQEDSRKIFMRIEPGSSKLSCKQIVLDEDKEILKPLEVKFDEVLSQFSTVQSNICVRIDTMMPSERDKELILQQLKDAVNPFVREFVGSSQVLVNGRQLDPDQELAAERASPANQSNPLSASDQQKAGDVGDGLDIIFVGANMQPCVESSIESSSDTDAEFEMINRLRIQGRIPGIAFLSKRASVSDAEQALKRDLTRSLYSRLELLTEELHITGGEMEVAQMLLPQRVRLCLPCCRGLPLSDYKFFSETAADVVTRVRFFCRPPGMTDDQLDVGCIDIAIEKSEPASLDDELSEVEFPEEVEMATVTTTRTGGMVYFLGLSVSVFLISLAAYYLLS